MASDRLRVAVFASGRGSNFQAILHEIDRGDLEIDLVLCCSDRPEAPALELARSRGIDTVVFQGNEVRDEDQLAGSMLSTLLGHRVDLIVLAGYMRKIPRRVVEHFRHRMLNIHPALLPAFGGKGMYGRRVHEAVIEYGVHWTGVTVHLVEEEYDTGPIVLQEPVPVYPEDKPADVAARVLEVEHRLYPEALRLFAQGRIVVEGRRVRILESGEALKAIEPAKLNSDSHDKPERSSTS